jgi:hypothetical protein
MWQFFFDHAPLTGQKALRSIDQLLERKYEIRVACSMSNPNANGFLVAMAMMALIIIAVVGLVVHTMHW